MKLGSLFDGSGTCPLAASAVGIIPAWASEIEPFPKAVTQSRFPKMAHLGDITKPLDPLLKQALLNTIVFMQSKTTLKTAECPSDPIIPSKPSLDEWEQGGVMSL